MTDLLEILRKSAGLGDDRNEVLDDQVLFGAEDVCVDALAKALYSEPTETAAELYYVLSRIAQMAPKAHHHLSARLGSSQTGLEDLGRTVRTVRLYESACALRDAIRARWGEAGTTGLAWSSGAPALLFVDDHVATPLREVLRLAARVLWNGAQIRLWNPREGSFGLKQILSLGPSGSLASVHDQLVDIETLPKDKAAGDPVRERKSLGDLLGETTHVIVDQFFEGSGDSDGLRGPEVIRFLGRVIPEVRRDEKPHRPRLIAFSRNQEPELISAALRSGADGYVLKAAPARLTEFVLARSVGYEVERGMSRNFECLGHLPPRIRDLTKALRIPGLDHHQWYQSEDSEEVKKMEQLLRAVPKAELHCHVGSCMSREFLVTASLIGLASQPKTWDKVKPLYDFLCAAVNPNIGVALRRVEIPGLAANQFELKPGMDWIESLANKFRDALRTALDSGKGGKGEPARRKLRSFLRTALGIPDWTTDAQAAERLEEVASLSLALTVLRAANSWSDGVNEHSFPLVSISRKVVEPLFVRTYLISLAVKQRATITVNDSPMSEDAIAIEHALSILAGIFYEPTGALSVGKYRSAGWRTPGGDGDGGNLRCLTVTFPKDIHRDCEWESDPLGYVLASGQRSSNLLGYLEGCEYSGSLHLQHPFLIHLYAEQVLSDMVQEGTVYRELRGSPDGYVDVDHRFSFADACSSLIAAFCEGQEKCVELMLADGAALPVAWLPEAVWGAGWEAKKLQLAFRSKKSMARRLPPKVGILLVGKRHKSSREMILEAAAGAMMYQESLGDSAASATPLRDILRRSGVVGFDLAGQEWDYPPALFAAEFERLGKLHIPLTVHAGENASSQFVEDAVLLLGAKRIGHALSLGDDKHLMRRLREDRICVELCPVSNHQTCEFSEQPGGLGRTYPLEAYLTEGIPVCLNTDNPIISRTDLIQEFFVASWTMRKAPMTFWLALLLVKTAFRSSFLPLPQRRDLIGAVNNYIEELLQDSEAVALMERLRALQY